MKKGFASMYLVYSFFLDFIVLLLTTLTINNYKTHFLNTLKKDIKTELSNYHLPTPPTPTEDKNNE